MSFDLLILGPPGSGKGTQSARIAAETGVVHVSTGDMLRESIGLGDALGLQVQATYDRGELVSDELMIDLMCARLSAPDAADGILLDGFPRTLAQAEALDELLARLGRRLALVLELVLSEDVAMARMLARAVEQGRTDDTPDVIRHRLDVYRHETEPLVGYYATRGILAAVPGDGTEDEVYAEVRRSLERAGLAAPVRRYEGSVR